MMNGGNLAHSEKHEWTHLHSCNETLRHCIINIYIIHDIRSITATNNITGATIGSATGSSTESCYYWHDGDASDSGVFDIGFHRCCSSTSILIIHMAGMYNTYILYRCNSYFRRHAADMLIKNSEAIMFCVCTMYGRAKPP